MARNQMYKLNLRSIQEKCLQVYIEDKTLLWHLRFGHLHYGGLKELAKKNMVHRLPNMDYEGKFCEECVLNKHVRTSFPEKAQYWSKQPLELIHVDQLLQNTSAVKGISLPLSMISHERLGFIF